MIQKIIAGGALNKKTEIEQDFMLIIVSEIIRYAQNAAKNRTTDLRKK